MNDQVTAIITWAVLGSIVGLLVRFILPGRQRGGIIITMLLGSGGALLGGCIGSCLGIRTVSGFDIRCILIATGRAILILVLIKLIQRRQSFVGCDDPITNLRIKKRIIIHIIIRRLVNVIIV